MFLLGIFSILQIGFLPGFLVVRALRIGEGLLRTLVVSLALSLILNHFLLVGLTLLHLCVPAAMHAVFVGELLLLAWLLRFDWRQSIGGLFHGDLHRASLIGRDVQARQGPGRVGSVLVLLAAGVALLRLLFLWWEQWGAVFQAWDAVVSWNRWAMDWAANRLPAQTWHYPQLLPTNLAVPYLFMGDDTVQAFGRGAMGLFGLGMFFALVDLGLRTRRLGYFGAAALGAVLAERLLGAYFLDGSADLAVAFMGFAAVYCWMLAHEAETAANWKTWVLLGAVCAAGAALTKQAGICVAVLYPFFAYALKWEGTPEMKQGRPVRPSRLALAMRCAAIILLLALPWYLYKVIQIHLGGDESEMATVLSAAHAGRTLWERIVFGWGLLRADLTIVGLGGLLLGGSACALVARRWRMWFLLLVVPVVVVWWIGLSYDTRNLAVAIPIFAAAVGVGAGNAAAWVQRQIGLQSRWRLAPIPTAIAVSLMGLAVVSRTLLPGKLLKRSAIAQKMQVQYAQLNAVLYDYHRTSTIRGPILTDYKVLAYLPGLESFYRYDPLKHPDQVQAHLAEYGAKYVLIPETVYMRGYAPEVEALVQRELAARAWEKVTSEQGYRLYYIIPENERPQSAP